MKRYAIIVAGGSGSRMRSDIPKQFIEIGRLPVLMHTFHAFMRFDPEIHFILVLPSSQIDYWNSLCEKYGFDHQHEIAEGGEMRYHSVKNGLSLIREEGIIGVHDGVRPFVSKETLQNTYGTAERTGNAIPVIDAFESVRLSDGDDNHALDRTRVKLVQTPQVFDTEQLFTAYRLPYAPGFTDDASVVEAAGFKINLVEGNRENIKITTPFDLKIAEALLK